MTLCIFNPEHDLCLANGSPNYMPPASAIVFACRDAALMQVLYPHAVCRSVYETDFAVNLAAIDKVICWGWNAVVKQALLKHGVAAALLPSDDEIALIRRLQHRATILPLQPDCCAIHSDDELLPLLQSGKPLVLKAPWSGAGRGLRWLRQGCTKKDVEWLHKTLERQGTVIVEPWRTVDANLALLYSGTQFLGYSYFDTRAGVYSRNLPWTDSAIEARFLTSELQSLRVQIEQWLQLQIWPSYQGPLGVDLMLADGHYYVSEINLRHTMGMVAHAQNNPIL